MSVNKLTKEKIIDTALTLTEECGGNTFPIRTLAQRLEVQAASLYYHFASFSQIQEEVALQIAEMVNQTLTEAVCGKEKENALRSAAISYRDFANLHPGLYSALIHMPASNDDVIIQAAYESYAPIRNVIDSFGKEKEASVHFQRIFRSATDGFIELTANHFMQKDLVPKEQTYTVMLDMMVKMLKELPDDKERKN